LERFILRCQLGFGLYDLISGSFSGCFDSQEVMSFARYSFML